MRPKPEPGRACFAETAIDGRTARRSVPTSNSANQDAQGAKRTHKIRYAEVPTGVRTGGAGIEAWGAQLRLSISEGGHIRPKTEGLREVERQSKSALAERLSIGNQQLAAKRKNESSKM